METLKKTPAKTVDPDHTIGGRFASAFASLFFSLPLCGLIWLSVNYELVGGSDLTLHASSFFFLIGFMVIFAFVFPKAFPTLFGRLWEVVLGIGKYW